MMQHQSVAFVDSIASPTPKYDAIDLNDHNPFHPRRPPTPTVRFMAFDGDRNDRPRHCGARFNLMRGTLQKTLGQLLGREWMIEEGEEKQDASRAEIDAVRLTERETPSRRHTMRSPSSSHHSPILASASMHSPSEKNVLGRQSWPTRHNSVGSAPNSKFGVPETHEGISR